MKWKNELEWVLLLGSIIVSLTFSLQMFPSQQYIIMVSIKVFRLGL